VKLLLDTQVAIWALVDPERIKESTRALILAPANEIFVSAVSVWEIAIKFALHKRRGAPPFGGRDALKYFQQAGFRMLSVTSEHVAAIEDLPPRHADPFDRLLAAQALCEPMRLVTADGTLAAYSDTTIPA
jgi:PIN domain nuclease of toxin-antitoxin system